LAQPTVNVWALKNYKPLTEETILAILDELNAQTSKKETRVLSSPSEAYALASRFRDVLLRYRFFRQKPLKILWSVVDRCGEAYYSKDLTKLYISKDILEEWSYAFQIPTDRLLDYLKPLPYYKILVSSDDPRYVYRINDEFFQLVGPVAQHLVTLIDPRQFKEMLSVISGLIGVYIMSTAVKLHRTLGEKPVIPWFIKLPMIYTLSGLESHSMKIRDVLEVARVNYVDNYFLSDENKKRPPIEWWRSVRTEAFEFMVSNDIIEQVTSNGYRLNILWCRMHEEGVKRYVRRVRERYERIYRGY